MEKQLDRNIDKKNDRVIHNLDKKQYKDIFFYNGIVLCRLKSIDQVP